MSRKIISLFTLLAFITFSISCWTTKMEEVKTAADLKRKGEPIFEVVKTTGEHIKFSKNRPGQIFEDCIRGMVRISRKEVEIDRTNITSIERDQEGKISEIINKDGNRYYVVAGTAREEEDKIIFSYEYVLISIPFSEVISVGVEILNPGLTVLVTLGPALVAMILALIFVPRVEE